ncbi:replication-associated recombination protein A [Sporomusa termitida]|uniref:Replication-associated recombination protein A n=1 Tax=Sporomusa termitida TaxID=2377 RepID=A0A517DU17_9FIRM|nr:replication-associated recombination protein A [Sporomusa termitida]QDR80837.1 Replication-associated recombination protein A [Sporomusa termitida]
MDLFSSNLFESQLADNRPLAVRMRPQTLADYIGQEELIGPGKFLRRMIENDNMPSVILYGPPGTGKTTLTHIIAQTTGCYFENLNAVAAGTADIRKVVERAKERLRLQQRRTILFVDEIHRFNKGQQDVLLPYVENGTVILIGATTENPYFEVNSPLLSRMRVVRLKRLDEQGLVRILEQALTDRERGLGQRELIYTADTLLKVAAIAGGDARTALNIIEQAAAMLDPGHPGILSPEVIEAVAGEKLQAYDKKGDNHYDVVSAFIKSMRGSDPDAALHYLARMLEAGEDVKFIARRLVICAAEDIGNADPQALVVAMAAAQAVQFIGMPEGRIPLAQAVVYLACAPKSNAAYKAVDAALEDVRRLDFGAVPPHLCDANYRGARSFGNGKGYLYPHDYKEGFVRQEYMPDKLRHRQYYHPTRHGREAGFAERLAQLKAPNNGEE